MTPRSTDDPDWLVAVRDAAARGSAAPPDLLQDFPQRLVAAAQSGIRPGRAQSQALTELGRQAAERGVAASAAVNLYLSTAVELWRHLPDSMRPRDARAVHASAEALLGATNDAIEALITGHQIARQQMIRHELSVRQEFLDDLLRGDADVARMVERAEPFGLDLATAHHVALAAPQRPGSDADHVALALERRIVDTFGDREVLVGTKDGRIVMVLPASAATGPQVSEAPLRIGGEIESRIAEATRTKHAWRVATGRAFPGSFGVARSYEEAREILDLAQRLGVETSDLTPGQLLVHRVIGRDQTAIVDLVRTVLSPLARARGGAEPLLETLSAYFACSQNATATARQLHLSVRTITYRLDRVRQLTGYDCTRPDDCFVLQTAVRGARLLDWPGRPLPAMR